MKIELTREQMLEVGLALKEKPAFYELTISEDQIVREKNLNVKRYKVERISGRKYSKLDRCCDITTVRLGDIIELEEVE